MYEVDKVDRSVYGLPNKVYKSVNLLIITLVLL